MTSADFAAAQQRVAARRQQRQNALQERLHQREHVQASGAFARLPPPAQAIWAKTNTQWDLITGREGTRPAFRVGQVDAELLDEELLDLLKGQVGEALKYYGAHLRDDYAPEILLTLRAIVFKLTIWDHDASYGAALQNLRYMDARDKSPAARPPRRWQKAVYGLVSVGGRYAWTKWEDYLLDAEAGYDEPSPRMRLISRLSSLMSTTHSMAAFASFLLFLLNGRYRTILDRILRLRLTPTTSQISREVSFEYLNRQLVWHAFTEFLLFILPLVGISRWRRWLARAWRNTRKLFRRGGTEDDNDSTIGGELGFLPERTCAICYQDQNPTSSAESEIVAMPASSGVVGSSQTDITNPYETIPCGCIYCFVCIAQRLEAEDGEGWTCLRCGELIRECKPWSGDVLEEVRSRFSSGKSVSFAQDEKAGDKEQEEKSPFRNLDPMPVEEDLTGEVAAELNEVVEETLERSLAESEQWAEFGQSAIAEDFHHEADGDEQLDSAAEETQQGEFSDDEEDAAEENEPEEEDEDPKLSDADDEPLSEHGDDT